MALSKAQIEQWVRSAQPAGEALEWVAACDGHISLRLGEGAGTSEPERRAEAQAILGRIRQGADAAGEAVLSIVIEFVDQAGTVIQRERFGAPAQTGQGGAAGRQAPEPKGDRSLPQLGQSRGKTPKQQGPTNFPGVARAIAVGAGKGGVGKSTVAVNLAIGLARKGYAVGLLDGDIYGPSLPTMLGLESAEVTAIGDKLIPFTAHGIKSMTLGKLVEADKPLIWRGPMAHGAFKQIAEQTQWGELDYLIIDLPPGTGDVPLTLAQTLRLTGAVIVCTPQKVAQDDASRAARMFQQLGVDVLGVVENMSVFIGDDGKEYDIFGRGGAEKMAQRLGLPLLGALPLTMGLRRNSDAGDPIANFETDDAPMKRLREALERLVENLEGQVALAELRQGQTRPSLTIH
ncbi:MAG: Mrp/NBP35 family ATP-binding protein [Phycisphaerales bacterium JB039]